MARLSSPPPFIGTFRDQGVCIYRMRGEDFLRTPSSLTAEDVKTKPEFTQTMAWAERLKVASRLASAVYAMLAPSGRKHKLYRALTGQAIRLLRDGKTEGETVVELMLTIQLKKKKRTPRPAKQQAAVPAIHCQRRPVRHVNTRPKAPQCIDDLRSLYSPYPLLGSRVSNGMTRKVISYAPG